ncbi:MAG TPA: hypothetical protein VEP90_13200 [Methylomirabilota bacterium]|nr:hypothetical protein [Methylomirabilota bacterium]
MKLHLDGRWLEKEALVDSNAETDLIHPRLFKDITVKKLKPILAMETLFGELQEPLECYDILFNITDDLRTTKRQMSNFTIIDIGDLNMILGIL